MTQPTPAPGPGPSAPATRPCPKCRRDCRRDERACPRCGLLVARFDRFAGDAAQAAGAGTPLDAAWSGCRSAWDEPAAHDRLLQLASDLGLLPELARRYRESLDGGDGGVDPTAERRLKQISILLEQKLRAESHEEASPRARRLLWMLGYAVAAAVLVASAWVFLLAFRHGR